MSIQQFVINSIGDKFEVVHMYDMNANETKDFGVATSIVVRNPDDSCGAHECDGTFEVYTLQ